MREKKRNREEIETERILAIQNDLEQLTLNLKSLQWEYKHPIRGNPARADRLVREVAVLASGIAVMGTHFSDEEARAIVQDIRAASRELVVEDEKKNIVKGIEDFMRKADGANERLGQLVRRRMKE